MPNAKTKTATANIHAVVGSDEAEVKRVAAELAAKLTPPGAGDFGLEVIDGASDNAEQAAARIRSTIEALRTLPFFGDEKLVWLKNANFLGDDSKARSAAVQSALEELGELMEGDFGSEIRFLLSAIEVDKRRSFYKSLAKRAELQVIDRLDPNRSGWEEEATELIRARAKKRKLQFDDDALELFVLLTGGDTREIDNELEKIDIFLQDYEGEKADIGNQKKTPNSESFREQAVQRPTPKAFASRQSNAQLQRPKNERRVPLGLVRELVALTRAGVIFELGNALAEADLKRALTLVRRLLDQGESAIGILLVAILPTIRNLLLAKDLMDRHQLPRPHAPFHFISTLNRLPANATEHLPRKKDGSINAYALGIAAQSAHRFTVGQLVAGIESCLQANLQLVTTQLDHELILTEIVVKLLGRSSPG
jgi:DNA polymerase III subunit delta